MNDQLDMPHLRQWIGREDIAEDILTPSLVEKFNATLGLPGHDVQSGDTAPRLIHFCLCQPAVPMAALGDDGHPSRGGFLPPVPLPRRMWAGSEIAFERELRVGDTIRRQSRVADVAAKTGRSGTLCFVTVDHEISAASGVAVTERQTLVYRAESGTSQVAPAPEPAPAGVTVEKVDICPVLLFRYSALTFNGHRIHYDRPYAMTEEGYPGLVVHGPLQASLLIHLAARCHGGSPPARFAFRGVSPAFDGQPLGLNAGRVAADELEL